MYKSILFSFKIDFIEFQSIDKELTMSTPFTKEEILLNCQKRLNDEGYSVSYDNFNFITKNDAVYVEGMAHEIPETSTFDTFIM